MRNLKNKDLEPIDFFDKILSNKRNSNKDRSYKDRVKNLRPNVSLKYDEYDNFFKNDNLVSLASHGYNGSDKEDLLKMYNYSNSVIQKLKTDITTEKGRIINTCQNCTINEVNTLDHLIPKGEFCEFSVHPKNLFPSCNQCNGYKNDYWRVNGSNLFLNLYINTLPDIQYLFISVNYINNFLEINFSVDNRNNIDIDLYKIIDSHYNKLHLMNRFKLNSHDVISDLVHSINIFKKVLDRNVLLDTIRDKINLDRTKLGFNHWESLLKLELLNTANYMDSLFN